MTGSFRNPLSHDIPILVLSSSLPTPLLPGTFPPASLPHIVFLTANSETTHPTVCALSSALLQFSTAHGRTLSRDTSLLAAGKEQVRQTVMLPAKVMLVLPVG